MFTATRKMAAVTLAQFPNWTHVQTQHDIFLAFAHISYSTTFIDQSQEELNKFFLI
jgi:hypothetical protein